MNRAQEIAKIEDALRRAAEAVRRGDPAALAGWFSAETEVNKPRTHSALKDGAAK